MTQPRSTQALEEARALAGPQAAWLASAEAHEAADGVLEILLPNPFAREAVRARCAPALDRAATARGFRKVALMVRPRAAVHARPAFPGFRVREGNQLAYAAVSSLIRRARPEIHPLVIHGPEGCGKSHLLGALAGAAGGGGTTGDGLISTDARRLARRVALAARDGHLPELRQRLRAARLFLVDDADLLAGKKRTEEEVRHALDAMGREGATAVFAMREHPARAHDLSEGLRSRLCGGLCAGIDP